MVGMYAVPLLFLLWSHVLREGVRPGRSDDVYRYTVSTVGVAALLTAGLAAVVTHRPGHRWFGWYTAVPVLLCVPATLLTLWAL